MKKICLNGKWTLSCADGGTTADATVPGCNFTDLLAAELIPDPFIALNEKAVQKIGEKDWIFTRTFLFDKSSANGSEVRLCFAGLDTLTEISLNGAPVASTRNAYRFYSFDVTDLLKDGENVLRVLFRSPLPYIAEKHGKLPLLNITEGEAGSCQIRKPAYHFGWDWAPHLLYCGITGDVWLEVRDGTVLRGVRISQEHADGKVTLHLVPEFDGAPADVVYTLTAPDGTATVRSGGKGRFSMEISSPELWWTHDLGAQPLYGLSARVADDENSTINYKIGLRTLVLDRSTDVFGQNFRFLLNGKPLFARGANYVPADFFVTRITRSVLARTVASAKRANMNMLRVWGGAYFADDNLCDLCDEAGILLWQDFMFACSPYPYSDGEFMDEVRAEIRDNVPRMRHHACLALWCGNNELEVMSPAWMVNRDVIRRTRDFFYGELPALVKELDGVTPYVPGSPCGDAYLKHLNADGYGDVHLWKVWHGMRPADYFAKRAPRFCSEFGLQSFPCENTVKTMCGGTLPESLDAPVLKAHQKAVLGNSRVLYYITDRYGAPARLWDVAYLSQLAQAYAAQTATERWRTLKDRCNGALYWQFNDCWGVTSWAGEDYYGVPKAVHYRARHFNAPVTVSVQRNSPTPVVSVVNDTLHAAKLTVTFGLQTMDGTPVFSETASVTVAPFAAAAVGTVDVNRRRGKHRAAELVVFAKACDESGNTVSERAHTVLKENRCKLPAPALRCSVAERNGHPAVTVSCSAYATGVELSVKNGSAVFGDNFFDMCAGEEKTVELLSPALSAEELTASLEIRSLADVKYAGGRLKDKLTAAAIFLKPFNFVNWLYRTSE